MWNPSRPQVDVLALEAHVARAGMALACPYSSADEYEAEVIAVRREAGAYGPRWHERYALIAAAATAAAFAIVIVAL